MRRFGGRLMCSEQCWSLVLRQRIERELETRNAAGIPIHAHRVPLGLLLLSLGWITEEQLQAALESQRRSKEGRIGDWLRRGTALTEKQITRALAMQWNCPVFDLEAYRPQPVEIPRELIDTYRILPLPARSRSLLYLAFNNRIDAIASYAVQHITGVRVETGLAAESAFQQAWTRALRLQECATAVVPVQTGEELYDAASSILQAQDVADARIARLHQHVWLRVFPSNQGGLGSVCHRDYLYLLPAVVEVAH